MKVQLFERLIEERKRLSLTQEQMAAAGGVAKRTYCNYEAGVREAPLSFLEKLKSVGADDGYLMFGIRRMAESLENLENPVGEERILWVYRQLSDADKASIESLALTYGNPELAEMLLEIGSRIQGTTQSPSKSTAHLTPDEAALLDNYRHCPPEGKAALKTTSAALAQPKCGKKAG